MMISHLAFLASAVVLVANAQVFTTLLAPELQSCTRDNGGILNRFHREARIKCYVKEAEKFDAERPGLLSETKRREFKSCVYRDLVRKMLVPAFRSAALSRRDLVEGKAEADCFFNKGDAAYENLLSQISSGEYNGMFLELIGRLENDEVASRILEEARLTLFAGQTPVKEWLGRPGVAQQTAGELRQGSFLPNFPLKVKETVAGIEAAQAANADGQASNSFARLFGSIFG